MLDLAKIDVDELAMALADQNSFDHHWFIDPRSGVLQFWTSDGGLDGDESADPDELDLVEIDPIPSYEWYQDMAAFADGISDQTVGRRLARALEGKGAFRRFKDTIYRQDPGLSSAWNEFNDARGRLRAVRWLRDQGLITEEAEREYAQSNPEPPLP